MGRVAANQTSKSEMVREACDSLGFDVKPGAALAWIKDRHGVEIELDFFNSLKSKYKKALADGTATARPVTPKFAGGGFVGVVPGAVAVGGDVVAMIAAARALIAACGGKEEAKRLIDAV